jgi:PAS domain-containing protein
MIKPFARSVKPEPTIDTSQLDASFQLLRATTLEVSKEAVNAAKVLEQRLQDSEHRFISTIDTMSDLISVKSADGKWQTINDFGQSLLRMKPCDYRGKSNEEIKDQFPHLTETLDLCSHTDRLTWEKKAPLRFDEAYETDHGVYYLDIIKTPIFNDDGSPKELITIGRDVTESREKHRRMKACFTALNSASDMIVIVDSGLRVFFCNDKFMDYFKVEDYNNTVGEKLTDVVNDFPELETMIDEIEHNRVWEKRFDGRFNLTVMPMMNGVPKPIYYVFTFKEITSDKYTINIGDHLGAN